MQRDGRRNLFFTLLAIASTVALVASVRSPARRAEARAAQPAPSAEQRVSAPHATVPADRPPATAPGLSASRSPARITGTVRTPEGRPVADAEVVLRTMTERSDDLFASAETATTDENGRFELEPSPGDYTLHAALDDRASAPIEPLSIAPGEELRDLELVLTGNGALNGLVVDRSGNPVAANVEVRIAGHETSLGSNEAGEDGKFDLGTVPDGPLVVVATSTENGARVERALARPEAGLILRLGSPLGEVTFIVVDEQGQPVAGAFVETQTDSQVSLFSTDDDGTARWQPTAPSYEAWAETADSLSGHEKHVADGSPSTVRLVVAAGSSVSGKVYAADGSQPGGTLSLESVESGESIATTTVTRGAYGFGPIKAGHYRIRYSADSGLLARTGGDFAAVELSLYRGEKREGVDLHLPATRRVTGIVRGIDGLPAAGVDVEEVDTRQGSSGRSVITDDDGRFAIDDVIGELRLRAAGNDGELSAIAVAGGAGDESVALALQATGNVDGVLRGRNGKVARVRCAGGLWHELEASGQYHMQCAVGSALEVESEGTTRSFPVEIAEAEDTFVELRW